MDMPWQKKDCHCKNCAGIGDLKDYISLISLSSCDAEFNVRFMQWIHTLHATIVTMQLPVHNFVFKVCTAFHDLHHHCRAQAYFLSELKEFIQSDNAVTLKL